VLGSRARGFESVPERSNAKDPAPLTVKEVGVKERRYIVCLNEEEHRKEATYILLFDILEGLRTRQAETARYRLYLRLLDSLITGTLLSCIVRNPGRIARDTRYRAKRAANLSDTRSILLKF
jgi:hypothetical protein